MLAQSKKKRIYDGDEARHLFEALYFTEPATSADDTTVEQRTTGLSPDSDTSTSLDSSDSDTELSIDGLTSSPCSRTTTSNVANDSQGNAGVKNKVRLEVFSENGSTARAEKAHPPRDEPQTSEAELEANEPNSGDCSFTEVDLPISESDCYLSEVDVTYKVLGRDPEGGAISEIDLQNATDEPNSVDCSFTEVDLPISESDCYLSEVDVTFKVPDEPNSVDCSFTEVDLPISESDCYLSEVDVTFKVHVPGSDPEGGAISEIDLQDATDEPNSGDCSFTEVDLPISESDCYLSEVDVTYKVLGSDPEGGAISEIDLQDATDEPNSGDCSFTEVDLPISESDCYLSEVDVTYKVLDEPNSVDCSFTEVDLPISESDCYLSEVDVTFKVPDEPNSVDCSFTEVDLPISESDCYLSEVDVTFKVHVPGSDPEGGAISEIDLQDATDEPNSGDCSFTEVDLPISESDCYLSEVDVTYKVLGSDPEGGAISEIDLQDATALRGRKRTRVHFIDGSSDSSCASIVSSSVKRRKENNSSRELSSILRMKCCRNYCLHKVSRKEVAYSRNAFQEKSKCEQRQWILQYLLEHHEESGNTVQVRFSIGVTEVCQRGWRLALGIPRTRLWQIQSHFQGGLKAYISPNHHRRGMQSKAVAAALMWLDMFCRRFGDKMPGQMKIHLPSCLTRASVYQTMKEEMEDHGEHVCSKVHFFRMWRKEMSHVTIPKVNRFSKCDVCTQLKQSIEKTNEKEARQALHQQREDHLTLQKTERMKYYKHAQKARQHPDKYISIIIDGMDQKSTSIPKFYRTSKSVSSAWKLPTHITGTIVHGRGQHMFLDNKEYPHDSNLTATILLQVLHKYSTTLPDTLYLQMDNCGRENKNQCLLGLCALLVELDVFKKVKLCFLMKGHTHEDIDQLFSRISTYTSKHNIPTLSSLLHHIPKSFNKPNTTAERIETIFNIRDWLQTQLNKPSHHSLPHQFKITKVEGKAIIQTKKWSNSSAWQATTGSSHILSEHPSGTPDVVCRKMEELHVNNLYRDMAKYLPYLNDSEHQEWMELLHSFEAEDGTEDSRTWPLVDILMDKESQSTPQRDLHSTPEFSNDEQQPIQAVQLGPKRKRPLQPVLKLGDMVGVYLEEFRNEWPQVGQVLDITGDHVKLHWYSGSETSVWTSLTTSVQGRRDQPYTGEVSLQDVLTAPFNLTKANKLPVEIQRHLKEKGEQYFVLQ
ncbi:uncharacterized protein LOC105447505 isoform X3 [Strongylocentrotus purpuratus]|uniref:DUF7869 domain-containing protein n=1 Tax=Strongylocentrotus purpuratus TaxID=7668 RepID=A0A7M7PPP6_STRPU|nr:uncharacterized protein LOC105447505 isoform X3 [Strongylocentrotus purpuratus]